MTERERPWYHMITLKDFELALSELDGVSLRPLLSALEREERDSLDRAMHDERRAKWASLAGSRAARVRAELAFRGLL